MKTKINNTKKTNLKLPFNKWMTKKGFTTEGFVNMAKAAGLPLYVGTVMSWRRGHKPRPVIRNMMEQRFPGITF